MNRDYCKYHEMNKNLQGVGTMQITLLKISEADDASQSFYRLTWP